VTTHQTPPDLPGYTFIEVLGGGGFADVYLFQQHLPERRVAVKVLRERADDAEARAAFEAEANLMARVSTHPNIVSVYGAAVARDGRPYLVMEYYPPPHFGERIRQGAMSVERVLEVGVKIASAVETAHRAQIIHRDIKPANILISEFGEPGLTDFGISGTRAGSVVEESSGYSPPYAPPEILSDQSPGTEQSDVYSLAATLWAMLAGYAPFEEPDRKLSRPEIIRRGLSMSVPPLPRTDVPASLELALQNALAKQADRRPLSAHSFALALQRAEQELGYRPTPLHLVQSAMPLVAPIPKGDEADDDKTKVGRGKVVRPHRHDSPPTDVGQTHVRSRAVIEAQPAFGSPPASPAQPSFSTPTRESPQRVEHEETGTIKVGRALPTPPVAEPASEPEQGLPRWAWIATAATLVLVVAIVGFVALGRDGSDARPSEETAALDIPDDVFTDLPESVENVTNLTSERNGETVTFRWNSSGDPDLLYLVVRLDDGGGTPPTSTVVSDESVLLTASDSERPCVSVLAFVPGVAEAPEPAPSTCETVSSP
jgi:eukaryotic-like serine/threonine-protein kinase